MFCEITVVHRREIGGEVLKSSLLQLFGNPIALPVAYDRSALYRIKPPASSICAFESSANCFVILRKVTNVHSSIYHLEGNGPSVTVPTMLQAVQEFSGELMAQLRRNNLGTGYKVRRLTARLFEDNGNETGLMGNPVTISSVFKEKFAWKEIATPLITFVTAALLFWRGLDNKPLAAAGYSLGVVVLFTLVDAFVEYWSRGDKIEWKLGWN